MGIDFTDVGIARVEGRLSRQSDAQGTCVTGPTSVCPLSVTFCRFRWWSSLSKALFGFRPVSGFALDLVVYLDGPRQRSVGEPNKRSGASIAPFSRIGLLQRRSEEMY